MHGAVVMVGVVRMNLCKISMSATASRLSRPPGPRAGGPAAAGRAPHTHRHRCQVCDELTPPPTATTAPRTAARARI